MLVILLLSSLAALALADRCPQGINFPSGVVTFGPWNADSNQKCSFDIYQQSSASFETLTLSIANIGLHDSVTISSQKGSIQLTNRKYFKQTISIYDVYYITTVTGANTQLVMGFDAAQRDVNDPPVVGTVVIPTNSRSFVLHLDQLLPYTGVTISSADDSQQLVIQKAEIVSDPADLLQWSNVIVYDDEPVGSLFNLIGNSGMFTSTESSVTFYLSQPINFKGAILITTSHNVKKFDTHGLIYANPALPTQTFAIGNVNAGKSYVTVIGNRDGSTPITVRTASPSTISVTNGGPDKNHDIVLPLTQLPVQMSGNLWTFYLDQGNGVVKFSAEN